MDNREPTMAEQEYAAYHAALADKAAELEALRPLKDTASVARAAYDAYVGKYGSAKRWRANATQAEQREADALYAAWLTAEDPWQSARGEWLAAFGRMNEEYKDILWHDPEEYMYMRSQVWAQLRPLDMF